MAKLITSQDEMRDISRTTECLQLLEIILLLGLTFYYLPTLLRLLDRLCGLVVRVPGY
jgi:hypothetical protein